MKRIIILSVSLLLTISAFSQDIKGSWSGVLNAGGIEIPLVINISEKDGVYSATMDSPKQSAKGISISKINLENPKFNFSIDNMRIEYEGILQTDSIAGTFKQAGVTFPLNFKKINENPTVFLRPQEPKPPYPYISEDITFENKSAGITLAGTLTMPSSGNKFPAVILVTGSGGQDRNEEIMGHKPFLVIADYLTRNGIAVLRYDDRGIAKSGGNYATSTLEDFATDATAAVNYINTRKEINPKKIGILGHSCGGSIAFMLAGKKDSNLAYIVSMAGVSIPGDSLLRIQRYLISNKMGISDEDIAKAESYMDIVYKVVNEYSEDYISKNIDKLTDEYLPDSLKIYEVAKTQFKQVIKQLMAPELKSLLNFNPYETLKNIKCPVLAINGEKDLQVPADINLSRIKTLVKGTVTIKKYPELNHLFQHCDSGLPNEYGNIEQTFSPEVLSDIAIWIKQAVK